MGSGTHSHSGPGGTLLDPATGLGWDQEANHDKGAIVTLAASGISQNSADQSNVNGRGVQVVVDITAISGTSAALVVKIQGKDRASGKYYDLLTSASLTATGTTLLTVYPNAPATANVSTPQPLPAVWRLALTITGTTPSVTATLGANLIV